MEEVFEQRFEGHPDAGLVLEQDADRIIVVRCNAEYARRSGVARSELERSEFRGRYAEWVRIMRESATARPFDLTDDSLGEGFRRATIVPLPCGPGGAQRFGVHLQGDEAPSESELEISKDDEALRLSGEWSLDLETGKGIWSREMFHITDWRGEEPPTLEQFEALVHLDDRKALAAFQRSLLTATEPLSAVFRIVTPSGQTRRVAVTAACVRDSQGKPTRITGVSRDVSAGEDELESKRRHDDALDVLFEENVNGVYFSLLDEPIDKPMPAELVRRYPMLEGKVPIFPPSRLL